METFFASPNRTDINEIRSDNFFIEQELYIKQILNSLPDVAAILNKNRQIIYSNDSLLNFLGIIDIDGVLGFRPGEALNCVNSHLTEAGCGTSEKCKYCGAVNAILESQNSLKKITKECRITAFNNNRHEYFDLRVTSTPFYYKNNVYSILTIDDISDKKRRAMLEKIFFHDIINIAGGLKGFIELLKDNYDIVEFKNYINIVNRLSNELIDEILSQRAITNAESGELVPNYSKVSSIEILIDTITYLSAHSIAINKNITVDKNAESIDFESDEILLKRVLINMLKNALEAASENEKITLNSYLKNQKIIFSVHNISYIPIEIQMQIFQRSFSSKGSDRGLGTYSIKLLTERYLSGNVSFTSTIENGTTFFVELPLSIK